MEEKTRLEEGVTPVLPLGEKEEIKELVELTPIDELILQVSDERMKEILELFKEYGGEITLDAFEKKFSKDVIGYKKVLAQMQRLGIVSYGEYDPKTGKIRFKIEWTDYIEKKKKEREEIQKKLIEERPEPKPIREVDETTQIIKEMKEFLKEHGWRVRLKDFIKRFPKEKHEEILTKLHKSGVVAVVGDYVHLLKG